MSNSGIRLFNSEIAKIIVPIIRMARIQNNNHGDNSVLTKQASTDKLLTNPYELTIFADFELDRWTVIRQTTVTDCHGPF